MVAAALGGCGGGDDETTFPAGVSQSIGKVEFLAEADRICNSTNVRIEAAADDLGRRHPPPAQVRQVALSIAVPALQTEVRAIRALGAPRGDEQKVRAILAATERGIAEIRADPTAVVNGVPAGLREASRLARAYGSQQCDVR